MLDGENTNRSSTHGTHVTQDHHWSSDARNETDDKRSDTTRVRLYKNLQNRQMK